MNVTQMPASSEIIGLREALAQRTGTDARDWFPVFKARYGMRVVCDSIRFHRGDGLVLTQLFTCCTAVDPIIASGLEPRYADVDGDTLAIAAETVTNLDSDVRGRVHAVMLQHTFGAIDEDGSRCLAAAVHGIGAILIEDCAHCVARMARDDDGSPLADVSIHSFGVEKILPTRFGGAVWINPRLREADAKLHGEIRRRLSGLPSPSGHLDRVTRLYINENRVLSRLGGLGTHLRGVLTRAGWYEPPISESERRGQLQYSAMTVTPWIARQATAAILDLDRNERGRAAIVRGYREAFRNHHGLMLPAVVLRGDPQPLLRFPIFMGDAATADRLIAEIRAVGAYAERWYRPELFPGVTDFEAYGLDTLNRSTVQVSARLTDGALCLPTELDEARAAKVISTVLDFR